MNATLDELRQAVAYACAETDANPSEAQTASGNYRKGKVRLFGLNISIETPAGAVRQGKSAEGKRWAVVMPVPYGYILQTESEADGDHLDVFLGPDLDSEVVFIVDQNKPDSPRFDEHKIMLGFRSEAEARKTYLASFTGGYGSKIFRSITPMTLPVFRQWVTSGDTKTPIGERKIQRYEFKESEHPRDESGEFTSKGNAVGKHTNLKLEGLSKTDQEGVVNVINRILDPHGLTLKNLVTHNDTSSDILTRRAGGASHGWGITLANELSNPDNKVIGDVSSRSLEIGKKYAESITHKLEELKKQYKVARGMPRQRLGNQIRGLEHEIKINSIPPRYSVVQELKTGKALGVAAHEAGHILDEGKFIDFPKAVREQNDSDEPIGDDWYKLSLRAAEHPAEMFAEITAAIHTGLEKLVPPSLLKAYHRAIADAPTHYKIEKYALTPGDSSGVQHRVGDTQTINGKQYRLNQNHRWELAEKEQQGEPKQAAAKPALSRQDLDAAAKKATANLEPTMRGVIESIHADPSYAGSGAKHETGLDSKTAKLAYGFLQANLRKGEAGGGQIRDLGNGKLGFASAAGALAITPDGKAEYTVHTQTVADATTGKQPPSDDDEIELQLADDQPNDAPKPKEGTQPQQPQQEYRNGIPVARKLNTLEDAEFHRNRTKAAHSQALANLDYQKYLVSHHRVTGNRAALAKAKEDAALAEYHERVARREHREAKQHHERTLAAEQKQAAKAAKAKPATAPQSTAPNPAGKPAPVGPKPFHEQTRKEFEASGQKATDHKAHIKSALKGGKRIPLNVLKDYPELIAEYARVSDTPKPAEARTAGEGETLVTPPPAPKTAGLSEEDKEQLRKLGFTDAHIDQMTVKPKSTVIPAEALQPKPKAPRKSKPKATVPVVSQTPKVENPSWHAVADKYRDEQMWDKPMGEYMESRGLSLDSYKRANDLMYAHNLASGGEADDKIVQAWNDPNSEMGKTLHAMADLNERHVENMKLTPKEFDLPAIENGVRKNAGRWKEYRKMLNGGETAETPEEYLKLLHAKASGTPVFYRKGELDKPVISTTTDPKGARSGSSKFTPDRFFTLDDMRKKGYRLVAGARGMVGVTSAQEEEYIWVKDTPKATAPAQTPVQDAVFQDANGVRRFLPSSEFRDVPKGTLIPPGVETTINTATGKTQARWHPKTPKATVDAFHKRHGLPIQRYADDTSTERWITIGASEDGDGEKHGGTPVKIDGKGKITAGPDKLAGKSLDSLPPREPSKEEGDNSSEPQEDTPRNSRLEKHRKALVDALREKFGDEAETLADEIGLTSHPRYHLQYNKKLPEPEARSLADKIDQAWRDTHKDLIEAERFDDVDWKPLKRSHELTDEEKQKNKEEFDKQREVEKAWADKNWKKPPAILETTPKQWAAIAARKQKASLEKDQKRLQALKAIEDEMMGLWGDTSEEGRARSKELATEFDAQMETKSVKMLLNRYRPGWMDPKNKPTVKTALEEAEEKLYRVDRDIDGHYFNDTSIPAIKDHANAVKEALEKGEKVSDELLQHYRYEDWVPRTAHERLFTIDAQKEFDKYHVSPSHKLRIAAVEEGVSKVRPLISALKAEYPSEYLSAHKKMERLRQEMNAAWTRHFDLTAKRAAERGENPALTQEVADELDKAWHDGDRASRAYNEARKEADELRQSHGKEWIKPLLPKKTAQVEFVGGEHLSEASRQKMEEAKQFLSSVLHETWGKIEVKVNPLESGVAGGDIYAKNGRAYASAGSIYMPVESAARVFIHETGHVVEHIRGQVLGALSSAFAVKQLADHQQKPEHLGSGYEPGEVGAQNGFMNSYVGKWYGRDSSEVLSMGLEYLAADPIRFSQESPEHFEYVVAAINGHLI